VVANTAPVTPMAAAVPMSKTVLYEMHVKGFTRLHPAVPEHLRGPTRAWPTRP
jgi:glycogen operon protein